MTEFRRAKDDGLEFLWRDRSARDVTLAGPKWVFFFYAGVMWFFRVRLIFMIPMMAQPNHPIPAA